MDASIQRRSFLITSTLVVLAVALLIGLVAFILHAISQAERRAVEEYRHLAEHNTAKWIAEQKVALTSGQQSNLHFYSTSNTDQMIREFAGMPEIKSIMFNLADLTDEGAKTVAQLPQLKELTLYGGKRRIGNAGLSTLSQSPTLETLKLVNTDVTDDGLAVLASFPQLKDLTLYREAFREKLLTDAAVVQLQTLRKLKRLNLYGGWMSNTAVLELRKSLPDCKVVEEDDAELP